MVRSYEELAIGPRGARAAPARSRLAPSGAPRPPYGLVRYRTGKSSYYPMTLLGEQPEKLIYLGALDALAVN